MFTEELNQGTFSTYKQLNQTTTIVRVNFSYFCNKQVDQVSAIFS